MIQAPMIPAQDCFVPRMLSAPGARLRAARFDAPPGLEPRGVCVLLNGQTEFIEKYFEVIDELRGRGFAVAALDWRGQGGSERLLKDAPLKAHIEDFAQYDADLDCLMSEMVEPMLAGARPVALAHSMGGHILLRALNRDPGRFRAAVFSAPMLRFSTRGRPRWLARLVTARMARGHATDFVWGMEKRDPLRLGFADQLVTSDPARFARTQTFLAAHPGLRLAGPTWGWVAAAYSSLAGFSRPGFAEAIATPALLAGAEKDRIVVTAATRAFAARMPRATYLEMAGAEHEILMERDVFRARFWQAFDAFLAGQI